MKAEEAREIAKQASKNKYLEVLASIEKNAKDGEISISWGRDEFPISWKGDLERKGYTVDTGGTNPYYISISWQK